MKQSLPIKSERKNNNRSHLAVSSASPVSQAFVDNRESTALQRQLIAKMVHSPQVIAQRKLSEQINSSPRMLAQRKQVSKMSGNAVQRVEGEEELLQGKFKTIQRAEEEEELLQGKFETVQRVEEEELLQGKFDSVQRATAPEEKANNTGLPDNLKQGIENLSGMSMDNVKVHYNSSKPAQLNALAYAQGTDIHLGSGQEKHLPHEAWHVVQQAQGRVKPTMQMRDGVPVNDDQALEHEADVMGAKAVQRASIAENTEEIRLQSNAGFKTSLAASIAVSENYQTYMPNRMMGSLGTTLQARFDPEDLAAMKEVAKGDKTLTKVLNELIEIHNRFPEDINYGVSAKEGHAAINEGGKPQVVVKDERWEWSKKIKNLFNAYGMDHDIKRQSMIIHELTHIAEMMANYQPDEEGWSEEEKPKSDKELAVWMSPPKDVLEKVDWDGLRSSLAKTDFDNDLKKYIGQRLDYAYAFDWETPTVLTELNYFLKAKGKSGNAFFNSVSGYVDMFRVSRKKRKK